MSGTATAIHDTPCAEYRPKVLIAQADVVDLQKIAVQAEFCHKFEYVLASTGQEILDKISIQCFDTVVLGLKFPDITGATVAYLIHEFDPLISIIFLTVYNQSILKSVTESIGCKIVDKNEAMKDIPNLINLIYDTALELPCDNEKRIVSREFVREKRERYLNYRKLVVPKCIADVVALK